MLRGGLREGSRRGWRGPTAGCRQRGGSRGGSEGSKRWGGILLTGRRQGTVHRGGRPSSRRGKRAARHRDARQRTAAWRPQQRSTATRHGACLRDAAPPRARRHRHPGEHRGTTAAAYGGGSEWHFVQLPRSRGHSIASCEKTGQCRHGARRNASARCTTRCSMQHSVGMHRLVAGNGHPRTSGLVPQPMRERRAVYAIRTGKIKHTSRLLSDLCNVRHVPRAIVVILFLFSSRGKVVREFRAASGIRRPAAQSAT